MAYVLQISLLSQERTAALVRRRGLQARVVDFAFLPVTDSFRQSAAQIALVERMSDAYHLDVCGDDCSWATSWRSFTGVDTSAAREG